jgi:hypothetical protein
VEFAEKGTIITGREVQSEYWVTKQYTVFVQVVSWLAFDAWRSRDSVLSKGAAVTVEPEGASVAGALEPAQGSYWAEVMQVPEAAARSENEVYGVRQHDAAEADPLAMVARHRLRHRKLRTKAYIGISDDRKHDSWAAQYYIKATLSDLKRRFVDTKVEPFFALHIYSDNASSHFKSAKTMYFLSTLLSFFTGAGERLLSPKVTRAYLTLLFSFCSAGWTDVVGSVAFRLIFRVFWEFGAPGHGKGVRDGVGALIKRTVRQDIINDRPVAAPFGPRASASPRREKGGTCPASLRRRLDKKADAQDPERDRRGLRGHGRDPSHASQGRARVRATGRHEEDLFVHGHRRGRRSAALVQLLVRRVYAR